MIAGHEFQKDLDARMLPFVFNIRQIPRREEHFIPHLVAGLLTLGSRFFNRSPIRAQVNLSTGLFAIFIHLITFYCSPFFLNMSIQFPYIANIIHIMRAVQKGQFKNRDKAN